MNQVWKLMNSTKYVKPWTMEHGGVLIVQKGSHSCATRVSILTLTGSTLFTFRNITTY